MPTFSGILRSIRNGLSKMWSRQFFVFLAFLALASFFWLLVAVNEVKEEVVEVPIQLTNVPENVVITDCTASLSVSVTDRKIMLMARKPSPLVIDFHSYVSSSSGYVRIPAAFFEKTLQAKFQGSTVGSVAPEQIEVYFNYGEKKTVPVRFTGELRGSSGIYVSGVKLEPDSVLVYAGSKLLDSIELAYTAAYYRRDIDKDIQFSLPLAKQRGMKFVPDSVNVSVSTDRLVEKTVKVPIQQANFPAAKKLRTFPPEADVSFTVGMRDYDRIGSENFVIVVSYDDLLANGSDRIPIRLKSQPDGVSNVRLQQTEVEYLIEDISDEKE